uniref:Uncharacterized protein n=1 Tax=Avena sativa TaxID=4498 RepID=A0ACD5U064_AVESA
MATLTYGVPRPSPALAARETPNHQSLPLQEQKNFQEPQEHQIQEASIQFSRVLPGKLEMSSAGSSRSTSPSSNTEWSQKENKMFEDALAYYGLGAPNLWDKVASAIGGSKSAEEVRCHFQVLQADVKLIESGRVAYPKYKTQGFWT